MTIPRELAGQTFLTQACRLTGHGRSAIAVIGVRGPSADSIIKKLFSPRASDRVETGQVRYGEWTSGESVVVTPIQADDFEIHCHGGVAAIERILHDLRTIGATVVDPWDFADGIADRLTCEAEQVLSQCKTVRTAAIAMDQARGAMQQWVSAQRARLKPIDDRPELAIEMLKSAQAAATELLTWAPLGTRLADPFRIVIIGPPNVGKSTLINRIVGFDRSITTSIAGTTRDVITAETVIDGFPVEIRDTAGIRETDDAIEREGISRARAAIDQADLVLRVCDPSTQFADQTWDVPTIDVLNKADLLTQIPELPQLWCVSAKLDHKIDALLEVISQTLCPILPARGQAVPLTERQVVALALLRDATDIRGAINALASLDGETLPS